MKRKLLTALLCSSLLMPGTVVPVIAQEAGTELQSEATIVHSGKIGTADWTIDSNGVLTIGEGEFTNDDELLSCPWEEYAYKVTHVDGTAKFKIIGSLSGAFGGLTAQTINLSGWDTSSVVSMYDMFSGCSSLTELNISNWDTSSVAYMYDMFSGCSSLTELNISNWDTSSVTYMSHMFSGCSSLTELNISNWDTSSVTDMWNMFHGCSGLTELNISNWDTSSVAYMDDMFSGCSSLTELNISNWDTSSVTDMSHMFSGCSALSKIRYSQTAVNIFQELPEQDGWYQDGNGPFSIADLPTVESGKTALLTRTNSSDPQKPSKVVMHRLYNPNSGEHFYTAADNEKDFLVSAGWKYEGEGWKAPEQSDTPVYRLYNANAGDHHYTLNATEKDFLVSVGWTYEGIGWYSDDAQSVPLYREYNPNAKAGSHNYTPNKAEHNFLTSNGWKDEGIAWYGLK